MKTYILFAALCLGSYYAHSAVIIGQGQSNGLGDNMGCEYPQYMTEFRAKAEKNADIDARKKCQEMMETSEVSVKRISDYKEDASCYYKGSFLSTSVFKVNTQAQYDCH